MVSNESSNNKEAEEEGLFELPPSTSPTSIASLRKLLDGFCGDKVKTDVSEESSLGNTVETRECQEQTNTCSPSKVVRDLNRVLEDSSKPVEERETEKRSSNGKEGAHHQDLTETTTDHDSEEHAAEAIATPTAKSPVFFFALNDRWLRTMEAILVTILAVAITFLIIHRLDGTLGISISRREEPIGFQIIHAATMEAEVAKEARKLIDEEKIVQEVISDMQQQQGKSHAKDEIIDLDLQSEEQATDDINMQDNEL